VSKDSLKGKMVGLYFSAHWCGPCRRFTPELVAFRDAHAAEFEVVFVSSDKTAEAMKGYMTEAKMQWPAVPYGDPAMKAIKQNFAIRGIPSLIILDANGQVITKEGRGDVMRLKDGAIAAWKAKPAEAAPAATPPATP
jgi:nucleoredoxin